MGTFCPEHHYREGNRMYRRVNTYNQSSTTSKQLRKIIQVSHSFTVNKQMTRLKKNLSRNSHPQTFFLRDLWV